MLLCATLVFTSCCKDDDTIPVSGVTLDKATLSLSVGNKETLKATIAPNDAEDTSVTWASSDATVATVSPSGEVTAVKEGTATITVASVADNTKKATCEVTVTLTWATGNLVTDGANGVKIGTPTDGGLFFQFGSLIGWSATGSLTVAVKPATFSGKEGWTETGIWPGTTGTVPFTVKDSGSDDEKAGIGDPCRYYLGGTWRLPTKDEYEALFKDGGYPNGTWKWENSSATNATTGLTFPVSGYRYGNAGNLRGVGIDGLYWSASPSNASDGYSLALNNSHVLPSYNSRRAYGLPVRCVK